MNEHTATGTSRRAPVGTNRDRFGAEVVDRGTWNPPHGLDVVVLPAGRWWNAVRVPAGLGERVLTLLGDVSGPVIQDGDRMYWLVPTTMARRPPMRDVTVLPAEHGRTVYLGVPPAHRTAGPGLYWRVPAEREPTDPDLLFVALRIALNTPSGP
ncbi:hypothetical protein [Streptomyces sp. NPDC018031]|uniref:hypothetical protein n=1 Tax=Streptomyces sp. NPDC018031 TaxID=3365033 RepID=UPI0037A814DE